MCSPDCAASHVLMPECAIISKHKPKKREKKEVTLPWGEHNAALKKPKAQADTEAQLEKENQPGAA